MNESKNYLGSTGGALKIIGINTSVTLKLPKKTDKHCQNISGNLKITVLTLK